MLCPKCAQNNPGEAKFCNSCGAALPVPVAPSVPPVAPPPAGAPTAPPAHAPKSTGLRTCFIVAGTLVLVGVILLAALIGGIIYWSAPRSRPVASPALPIPSAPAQPDRYAGSATPTAPVTAAPAAASIPTSPTRAADLETALRTGNAQTVLPLIHPSTRQAYQARLLSTPAQMARVAQVLATRRLVQERGRLAEYEVTDAGKKFPVVFEKIDGQWLLVAF